VLAAFEEHGQFAARIAAQVIRAYVLKQRARENNVAYVPRVEAAPGMEQVPVASPAVLAALRDHDSVSDEHDRTVLAAALQPADATSGRRPVNSPPEGTDLALLFSGKTKAALAAAAALVRHPSVARAPAAGDRLPATDIEMAAFWSTSSRQGGLDSLHANRYVIKLPQKLESRN
jgi:hypothetical protein